MQISLQILTSNSELTQFKKLSLADFFILHIVCHLTMTFLSIVSPFSEIPYLVNFSLVRNLLLMSKIFDLPELAPGLAQLWSKQ